MKNNDLLKEIQRKGDYSIALVDEIALDLSKLNEYPSSKLTNKLDEINIKLNYAEKQGINITKLEKQVKEFRILSFSKNIDKKIDEIKVKGDFFNTNLTRIEEEYEILKKEDGIDKDLLSNKMSKLYDQVLVGQLLLKVKDISVSKGASIYNLEDIQNNYLNLKDKGADISEIEEILFEI